MHRVVLFALLVAAIGCSQRTPTGSSKPNGQSPMIVEPPKTALTEKQVLDIAKAQVAKNDTWGDHAEYALTKEEDGWSVHVWRIPKVPGGARYISIDRDGAVVRYDRGQ